MKTEVEIIDEFTLMHKTKDADVAEIASMEAVLEAIGAHRWQKYLIFLCCAWGKDAVICMCKGLLFNFY